MPLTFYFNDPCPRCAKPMMQAVIERHPSRNDLALHNFTCLNCGPLKTKIISLNPGESAPELTA